MQKVLLVFISILTLSMAPNVSLASIVDEKLLEETKHTVDTIYGEFQKKTAFDTLLIEYVGDDSLSNKKRSDLSNLVSVYSMKMNSQILALQSLKKRIEQYQGDDWEQKFGDTDLWQELNKSLISATILKLNTQYPKVLLLSRNLKEKLILEQLKTIKSLEKENQSFSFMAYKAKLYSELSYSNKRFYNESVRLNQNVVSGLDSESQLYFSSLLELIKLGANQTVAIDKIYRDFSSSKYADSVLMNLKFALTAYLYSDNDELADEILCKHPKVAPLFCDIIFKAFKSKRWHKLTKISTVEKFSDFTADCISYAILNSNNPGNLKLAQAIANNRVNALTIYVQSHCFMDEAGKESEALNLLILSSNMASPRQWLDADFSRDKLSRIACEYAFDKLRECDSLGSLALKALENYQRNLGRRVDEELEYSLASLLLDTESTQAQEILGEIAQRGSAYSAQAKFDLALYQLSSSSKSNQDSAIENLKSLLEETSDKENYTQGVLLYAYLVLDKRLADKYSDILNYLNDSRVIYTQNIASVHVQILLESARVEDAIVGYADFLRDSKEFDASTIKELAFALMQKYEFVIANAKDPANVISSAKELLARSLKDGSGDCDIKLLLAELNLLDNKDAGSVVDCGKNGILALRYRARKMQLSGKYDEATSLWTDLALSLKDKKQPQSKQSWQWWRAKYYQLHCYSLSSDFDSKKLKHAISVLLSSEDEEENFWTYKMIELRNLTPDMQ